MTVLFVVPCGAYLPSGTVRVRQFLPFLDRRGIAHLVLSYYSPGLHRFREVVRANPAMRAIRPVVLGLAGAADFMHKWWTRVRILSLASRVDLVFLQGVLPPGWYMRALNRLNPHTVIDLDDAIFLGNQPRAKTALALPWRVIAGSHFIFDYAAPLNPGAVLVPSSVPLDRYEPLKGHGETPRRAIRIGWLGSPSTVKYLRHLVEPLRQLAAEGHAIELLIDGAGQDVGGMPFFSGITVTFTASYRERDIPSLAARYDIGVMPLDDGPWERAKCAMKALIYMAAGKPAICSRVGENPYVIEDGVNGFLVDSEDGWTAALRGLIADPQRRADIGRRGRKTIEERYSADVSFALLDRHVFSKIDAG
jgi:glycosyltransferase involved in cell wall biosynthesis